MITFLCGFAGAIVTLGLIAGGVLIGWHAHKAVQKHMTPTLERPGEAELKKEAERQKAFRVLQDYSAERAYGMVEDPAVAEERAGGDFR